MKTVKSEKEFGSMKIEVMYVFGKTLNEELAIEGEYKESVFVKITNNGIVMTEFAELDLTGEMPKGAVAKIGHSGKTAVGQATLDKINEVISICKKEANNEKEVKEQNETDVAKYVKNESNKIESRLYDEHEARVEAMMTLSGRSY